MSRTDSPQQPPASAAGSPALRWTRLLPAVLLGLLGGSWCQLTLALASDREQPIHISSNSAERDESKGITTYSGAVEISQGTLQIQASKVVIHSSGNRIFRIVATGSPAQYQQVPAEDKQLVVAKGETIEYLISDDRLRLISKASLYQSDGTTMTGDTINYDIKASIVTAESGSSSSSDRIHMIIPPKPKDSN